MKLLSIVLALTSVSALAQPMQSPSVNQIIDQLAPPITRGLRDRNLEPKPRSIDLVIQFDFDSAKLQDSSKLDGLVTAMKSERLINIRFTVEGHTDAKGTEAYNQNLSMRRADSVVNYLSEQGIEKKRMEGIGKGFTELLYPDKPQAMENRRVRITTIQ